MAQVRQKIDQESGQRNIDSLGLYHKFSCADNITYFCCCINLYRFNFVFVGSVYNFGFKDYYNLYNRELKFYSKMHSTLLNFLFIMVLKTIIKYS